MRVKQSKARSKKNIPAPMSQRRKSMRKAWGPRRAPEKMVAIKADRIKFDPVQWFSFFAVGLTCLALAALIWTMTARIVSDQTAELDARNDQYVRSVAFVLSRQIEDELHLVDQSLSIVQDAWKKDSDSVDLGLWRKQLFALTAVANDIFIANERGVIVQGTLPQSIGQGFGSAYVTYPNGSLEVFDPDGRKNPDGRIPGSGEKVEARQFLIYIVRPLDKPLGWFAGASYRSEGITKLFAGANLGQNGVVGLTDLRLGRLQAIVGNSAQFGEMNIAKSELAELIKKNDSGVWSGVSPMDKVNRFIGYRRIPGRDMAVIVGVSTEAASLPLASLAMWSRGLAVVGTILVFAIGGIVIWSIATSATAKARRKNHERVELNLMNARQELGVSRARMLLTEPETAALIGSATDGVARLDNEARLRLWNQRFAELAGLPLDAASAGTQIEALWRAQAEAGMFGDPAAADQAVSTRLTALHTAGEAMAPPVQAGPDGEQIAMHVRGVADGGSVIVLTGHANARLSALPPLPILALPVVAAAGAERETADETTDF